MEYGAGTLPRPSRGAVLEVDDLHYSYDPATAPLLNGVSFDVQPGPHGRGRRRHRLRQEHADQSDDPARRPRRRGRSASTESTCATCAAASCPGTVALVPQTAFMFDDTVRGNVTLGADIPDDEVWAALRDAQADGFVAALSDGLDTQLGERGTSLSGRPAPAPVARPRARPRAAPDDPRRRHLGGGPGGRGPHPRLAAQRHGRLRLLPRGRGLPQGDDLPGRRGPAPRRRPHRRPRHPRRAHRRPVPTTPASSTPTR